MLLKLLRNSLFILLLSNTSNAQFTFEHPLSDTLQEISGLEKLDDSTLIAINDGGNSAEIYLLNLSGKIIHTVKVDGVKNKDWEDLASDGKRLFIADIGNNQNKRKSLSILIVDLDDLTKRRPTVTPDEIKIRYQEQHDFPPNNDSLFFDAEALTFYNDSLWIFTKPKSEPWNGHAFVYCVPAKKGEYNLEKRTEINVGNNGWWSDAFTAADYYDGKFYLMTYNRIKIYKRIWGIFFLIDEFKFDELTQKESIKVLSNNNIFIADEKQVVIGGGNLYKLKIDD